MRFLTRIRTIEPSIDGGYQITFDLPKNALNRANELKDIDIDLKIEKRAESKSLQANNYAWHLLTEIAKELSKEEYISKWDVYKQEIVEHSILYDYKIIKPEALAREESRYRVVEVINTGTIGGQEAVQIQCYYGSSFFNKEEMRIFLDGIVQDARALGIETENTDELEQLIKSYEPTKEAKELHKGG